LLPTIKPYTNFSIYFDILCLILISANVILIPLEVFFSKEVSGYEF